MLKSSPLTTFLILVTAAAILFFAFGGEGNSTPRARVTTPDPCDYVRQRETLPQLYGCKSDSDLYYENR